MLKKRKRTLLRNVTQIMIVLAVFVGMRAYLLHGSLPKGPAPGFTAPLLDGGQFSLSDKRGEPLLIHFWATWCKICALNDGAIDGLAEDMQVVTIAMESGGEKDIRKEMEERELTFPVIVDGLGKLANKYHVKGVPTNYIIDANGKIRYVEVGYTTGIGLRIRMWLASM
jgi:peroxiredoxin